MRLTACRYEATGPVARSGELVGSCVVACRRCRSLGGVFCRGVLKRTNAGRCRREQRC